VYFKAAWAAYQAELRTGAAKPGGFCGYLQRETTRMKSDADEYSKICGFEVAGMSGIVSNRPSAKVSSKVAPREVLI
jgi:hypothetical protein